MATSLDKWENKLLFHHRHVKCFHMVKRLQKLVQYVQRYSTKYVEPREHATQFPFVSLFSADTTGPILTKFLHVIVALVVLFNHAYAPHYPIPFPNGSDTVDWSGKNADFSDFDSLPWQRPLKNQKKAQWGEQALTPVYKFWNFGEDCSISVWATGARKSTIKKFKKNKEKTSVKYIALPASLPSRLIKKEEKRKKVENVWQSLAYSPLGAIVSPPSEYLWKTLNYWSPECLTAV